MTLPVTQQYDVIIIGGGWSGLMAAKYCLAEGLRTVVLEGRDSPGGVWSYTEDARHGGVMKTTHTTSSRCVMEISDFPMPADYPAFPSHEQIRAYLDAYCARFGLIDHIRFGRPVTRASRRGPLWEVTTGEGSRWLAPRLIVASGMHQYPNEVADDARFQGYSGTLLHSSEVKEVPRAWSGEHVVAWGGGESASDIAEEASRVAERVFLCIPNGVWFVPKEVDRLPGFPRSGPLVLDHISSRLRLRFSPTHRYSPFIYEYLQWAFGFNGHGQQAWRTDAPYNRSFFNKSAGVLARVKSGHVVPKRDIASCRGTTVRFTDGTSAHADRIVTCSGYRPAFPFLDPSLGVTPDPRTWFKYIFWNEDPSLAFVGFARPVFGSIPGLAELQARYVARVFSGAQRLPGPARRRAITARDARYWNQYFRTTSLRVAGLVDHFLYSNQLARLIGCAPRFWKLLITSPRRWWLVVTAPWNGCQFWLNDPRHHDRIFATLRRYSNDRMAQAYIWLLLTPVLPLFALRRYLNQFVRELRGLRSRPARTAPPAIAGVPEKV
jgi:dimethylaniline monooxygenase (N-oxide forming)